MEPNQIEIPKEFGTDPYEFTTSQNEVIEDLGNSLKWVSMPIFVLGAMCLMNFFLFLLWAFKSGAYKEWNIIGAGLFMIMNVVFFVVMARWLMTASVGFAAITRTKGKDISFLMIALNNLRAMFSVLAFCVKAFLIISIIGLVMSLYHYYRSDSTPVNKGPAIVKPVPTSPAGL